MKTVADNLGIIVDKRSFVQDISYVLPDTKIGLEIELEDIDRAPHLELWTTKKDGSLRVTKRGKVSYEIIFNFPYSGIDITKALEEFDNFVRKCSNPPSVSDRTSLQVHLDVQTFTPYEYYKIIVLYTIVERLLYKYCGEGRENNYFSWPFYKAPSGVFDTISNSLGNYQFREELSKFSEDFRYNGMNLTCTHKFGSIEFRQHPGTLDINRIKEWVNILMSLKKYILKSEDRPDTLIRNLSFNGIRNTLEEIFGEYTEKLIAYPGYEEDVMKGIRLSQEILTRDMAKHFTHLLESNIPKFKKGKRIENFIKKRKGVKVKELTKENVQGARANMERMRIEVDNAALAIPPIRRNRLPIFDDLNLEEPDED